MSQKSNKNDMLTPVVDYVSSIVPTVPRTAIVLGSGLGQFAEQVKEAIIIPYKNIPHYPETSVESHSGELIVGTIEKTRVLIASGRFHLYEGYDLETVTLPIRMFHRLGVKYLILTNAAGSVRKDFFPGTLMLLSGHLDFTFREGVELPSTVKDKQYHSPELLNHARDVAQREAINLKEGIYVWTLGPSFETPAEIDQIRELGGAAVGMSTVPEIRVAGDLGLKVIGISCLTNYAAGITSKPLTHDEVMETADRVSEKFTRLLTGIVREIGINVRR